MKHLFLTSFLLLTVGCNGHFFPISFKDPKTGHSFRCEYWGLAEQSRCIKDFEKHGFERVTSPTSSSTD